MTAYYNEFDPFAAQWLRNLIAEGHIAPGDVDERSITEVQPDDLRGYTQCHFFAGIGGWSYALRLAGWPDDRPVWTGSCPCQPFSNAGKRKGTSDARHLWPVWRPLIAECGAPVVFGEQVASKDGRAWLAGVRAEVEALGYAVGAADLCAASAGEEAEGWADHGDTVDWQRVIVGAPHIRQRVWFVADRGVADAHEGQRGRLTDGEGCQCDGPQAGRIESDGEPQSSRDAGGVADSMPAGRPEGRTGAGHRQASGSGATGRMGDAEDTESQGRGILPERAGERAPGAAGVGFWSAFDFVHCTDGKARRVEPGTFPLAHGVSNRVGLLRGYGNAIVPQVAAEFIRAYDDEMTWALREMLS